MTISALIHTPKPMTDFVGRRVERDVLDRLLGAVRSGQSRTLVVHGPEGVGKTALFEMAFPAKDCKLVRVVGARAETQWSFGGVQRFCRPLLPLLERLPGPQAEALQAAIGLAPGPAPDLSHVGLALLGLLAEAATEQAAICVIEDFEWLDPESARSFAYAARRLRSCRVGMIFGARSLSHLLLGLPALELRGLSAADATALLRALSPVPLLTSVQDQIVAEANGNPLAIIEFLNELSCVELAGGFGLASAGPRVCGEGDPFRRQFEDLCEQSRMFLVICAAEPTGNLGTVLSAAAQIGIGPEVARRVNQAGLADFRRRVQFSHPHVRSMVYNSASELERQTAHRALADVVDGQCHSEWRAWHLGHAALSEDECVAAELERVVDHAQSRAGYAAAAAFLEAAVNLSGESESRFRRALAAADMKHLVGAEDVALNLIDAAALGSVGELQEAKAAQMRARIADSNPGRFDDGTAQLLRVANRLEKLDTQLARETHLDALLAIGFSGRRAAGHTLRATAEAANSAPRAKGQSKPSDTLLDGLACAFTQGYCAGAPLLAEAVQGFRNRDLTPRDELRWLGSAAHAALCLWDDESFEELAKVHLRLARETGALSVLPSALTRRIVAHVLTGELAAAERAVEEQRSLADTMRIDVPPYGATLHAAWRGHDEAEAILDGAVAQIEGRGESGALTMVHHCRAIVNMGLGRFDAAFMAAMAADTCEDDGFAIHPHGLSEVVESAARVGEFEVAKSALIRLADTTSATRTSWGAGIQARSEALLADDRVAEDGYLEAINLLGQVRVRPQLARTHLLYGEWLRRQRRRKDAREQLQTASEMFESMSMEAFLGRAKRELAATGGTAQRGAMRTKPLELTPQEAEIVELARIGLSNPEIGSRLFISAHTVQYHLRKVYVKLGIKSRHHL
jgi:DNA-binding CsgD family transcriptional regulator